MTQKTDKTKGRGGRPSKQEAGKVEERILDAAAAIFFDEGYGAASIEEIARRARISKRTFYTRYDSKAAIFSAVVHRVIERVRPDSVATEQLFHGASLAEILHHIAQVMLQASLTPQALSLYRIVMAESVRFPELAMIMHDKGARREAIARISELLHKTGGLSTDKAGFAAEQFMMMVVAAPQRRAMGLGPPLGKAELDDWIDRTVELFMTGCGAGKSQ